VGLARLKGRTGSRPGEWGLLAGQGVEDQRIAGGMARSCCKEKDQGGRTYFEVQLGQQSQEVQGMRGGQQRIEAAEEGCERESSSLGMEDLGDGWC